MIRAAVAGDLDAVVVLEADALGVDAWSRPLLAEGLRGLLPTMHYLVAQTGGEVVGYAAASVAGDIAELQRIAVTPAHRRAGLAGALLSEVAALGRTGGADRLLLEVRSDNTGALAFYAGAGLVEIDRRPRYYRDGATAVVMRLGLRPGCGGA